MIYSILIKYYTWGKGLHTSHCIRTSWDILQSWTILLKCHNEIWYLLFSIDNVKHQKFDICKQKNHKKCVLEWKQSILSYLALPYLFELNKHPYSNKNPLPALKLKATNIKTLMIGHPLGPLQLKSRFQF